MYIRGPAQMRRAGDEKGVRGAEVTLTDRQAQKKRKRGTKFAYLKKKQ